MNERTAEVARRDSGAGVAAPTVVGVVPLFEPAASARTGIAALAAQVDAVVLVDDGSPTGVRAFVAALQLPNVRLVESETNLGIAHALNSGIAVALNDLGADLVLTTDQDSVLAPDYVANAVDAVDAVRRHGVDLAAVAAGTVDERLTRGHDLDDLPFRRTRETVQSGMVFPAEVLRALGRFDESFFIDCVDTDYILRGARSGLATILAPECRMGHAMGEGIDVRLPFFFKDRNRRLPYHGPVRRYYITRNRVRLVRRHFLHSPRWALRQTYEQTKSATADLVWGADRRRQAAATAIGLIDGVRGRGGRIAPRLESFLRGTSKDVDRREVGAAESPR